MPVLVAAIDAKGAKRGAQDFSQSANQIKRDASAIAAGIGKGEKAVTDFANESKDAKSDVDRFSGGLNDLKAAVATLGIALLARQFVELTDAMTLVESRLKLVTNSAAELVEVQADLFALAQETRQGYVGLVDVYGRFARATRDLNIDQDELLDTTELISKSIILSGATAQESNAALIQLSQGFAAGALRGDEFRSVSEQLPAILTAVSDGLGITRGELRRMAFEGELTAQRFFEGMSNSAEQIERDFEEMTVTVGQASVQMSNSLAVFIKRVNESAAVTGFLVETIDFWRNSLDDLGVRLFPTLSEQIGGINMELADLVRQFAELDQAAPSFAANVASIEQRRAALLAEREALLAVRDSRRGRQEPEDDGATSSAQSIAQTTEAETKALEELERSRSRSAAVQAQADERVRQGRIDLLRATQEIRDEEKSLADQIIDRNLTAQEQYNQSLLELESIRHRLTDDQFGREFKRLGDELREADPLFQSIITRADEFATAISAAMAQAVTGTLSWNEALQQIANSILQIAINIAIEESIRSIFKAVATSLTSPSADASGSVGAPTPGSGVNPGTGTGANVIGSAARAANSPVASATPSFNVSIQNSGAPADVERVEVARADPDQVDMTVFIRAAAQNVSQNGQLGRSIGQSFGLRRQGKQN